MVNTSRAEHDRVDWDSGGAEVTMVRIRGMVRVVGPVAGAVLATLLIGAVPAVAHVEVSVEPAQAGATDAVVSFTAEAESDTAGVSLMQVQLPEGVNPGDVTLQSGPPGWALTPTNDGYSVSGPPLQPGAEVRYAVKVKQLPDAPTVAFKTLQSYTDGTTDQWIELQTLGGPEPAHPAPIATLAGATPAEPPPTTASGSGPCGSARSSP